VNNGDRGKIFMKDTSPLLLKQISKISSDEAKDLIKLMDLGHLSGAIESLVHSILDIWGISMNVLKTLFSSSVKKSNSLTEPSFFKILNLN